MTKQELITQLNEEFDTCIDRLNHWKQTTNEQMIGYFDGRIFQILLTLEVVKNLNEETRKGEEICEKCKKPFIPRLIKPLTICDKCADELAANLLVRIEH